MPIFLKKAKQADAGFTLVEVLVAITIFSVCVVGILRAFDSSLIALGISKNCLWSGMLINEKISELEAFALESDESHLVSDHGVFAGSYSDFRWETVVSDVSVDSAGDDSLYDLKMVNVAVWRDGTKDKYSASTYLRLLNDIKGK